MTRDPISKEAIERAFMAVKYVFGSHLKSKGDGAAVSLHEAYDIVAEEMEEAAAARRKNDKKAFAREMIDVATAAVFAVASTYQAIDDAADS